MFTIKGIKSLLLVVLCAVLLVRCSSRPENVQPSDRLPAIWPDYVGVTIPVGIAPLNFAMSDDSVTTIDVNIEGSDGTMLHDGGQAYTDFDIDAWHQLLEKNRGRQLSVTVCAEKEGQWMSYKPFVIYVSTEPLEAWGVTYRLVAPGYQLYSHMALCQRDLSTFEETAMVDNRDMPNNCVNCHTANRTNPDQYVFHIRGENGATAIWRNGTSMRLPARNDTLGGSMVYPSWHPGGRYCAFSTNKTSQIFHTGNMQKRIEVYDSSSDVFVYDTQQRSVITDTLIMRKYWAENCPAFSGDGRWLYFTTARRQVYPTDYDKERYSLCRVTFDEATGRLGTTVDTLVNTRLTGKSATWPRPSYDGRYLMYTQTDYGYFSIWHPEADLWLLDLQTGDTRPIDAVNSSRAESLHRWGINSRWFLFTSRRTDGLYSRLYFAAIDDSGRVAKPFLLPQRNPKHYYRRLLYSYNTPDFASRPVDTPVRVWLR
ncbi:MAG: hypothetical protein K5764_05555 [Prevotella sp.]|nr:hypothetical protein [Prevotella sp.]